MLTMMTTRKSLTMFASAVALMGLVAGAQAASRYVPSQYSKIQSAINASVSGDTIVVAAGTYRESLTWQNKNLTIQGSGATISPGYDPATGTQGPGGRCLYTKNLTAVSRISGFTFKTGNASDGGGMRNEYSSPNVSNCTFSGNGGQGGGMSNYNSSPTVNNCTFSGNYAGYLNGGGMANDNSSPIITNCTFSGNTASNGGGMYNWYSSPILTNCTFTGNSAGGDGGGIANDTSRATIANCTFRGNATAGLGGRGGGIFTFNSQSIPGTTITNCTFNNNTADDGGGLFNSDPYQLNVRPILSNCILWGNTAQSIFYPGNPGISGNAIVTYSDVQGLANTVPDANGNFGANPLFVDAPNGNLNLQAPSPCRDRGNNAVLSSPPFLSVTGNVLIDLDTCRRVSSNIVDQGAYEFQSLTNVSAQIQVTKGTPSYPDSTSSFTQTLTLKNTGGTNLKGPISVILTGLSGFTLTSRTGVTSALTPAGRPYINSSFGLAPGAVVAFRLKFTRTSSSATFSYTTQVYDGYGTR